MEEVQLVVLQVIEFDREQEYTIVIFLTICPIRFHLKSKKRISQ